MRSQSPDTLKPTHPATGAQDDRFKWYQIMILSPDTPHGEPRCHCGGLSDHSGNLSQAFFDGVDFCTEDLSMRNPSCGAALYQAQVALLKGFPETAVADFQDIKLVFRINKNINRHP